MDRFHNRGDEGRRDEKNREGRQWPNRRDLEYGRGNRFDGDDRGRDSESPSEEWRRFGQGNDQGGQGPRRDELEDWQQPRQFGRDAERGTQGGGYREQSEGRFDRPYRGESDRPGFGSAQFGGGDSSSRFGEPSFDSGNSNRYGVDRQTGQFSGKGPKGYQRSDERIREDLCDRLTADPRIDAEGIQITVTQGVVSLEGSVPSRMMKRAAEDLAEQISGVSDVTNTVRVQHQALTARNGH